MQPIEARVGIVIRTKNRPQFLARALADIAAQTHTDWQAQIVNDGGDAAAVDRAVAALAAPIRSRIGVTHHESSQGRSAAANAGIHALAAEYVVLHDDDDRWAPEFLARTVSWLDAHPGHAGVAVRTEIVYEAERDGTFVEVGRTPFWPGLHRITYAEMLRVNRFVPIAYLYRRALHDEVGGYREDVHAAEDWEFNLRVAARYAIGFLADGPLAFWHQRAGVDGELGNSMFVLAQEHDDYDMMIRDEALRAHVAEHGPGLALYLTRYLQDELARQLDERRTLGERATRRVQHWYRARRTR